MDETEARGWVCKTKQMAATPAQPDQADRRMPKTTNELGLSAAEAGTFLRKLSLIW